MVRSEAGYGVVMNDADWLRKRWKHRFHGCVLIPAALMVGGALAALQQVWG
jgi:hypothetical protein